MNTQRQRTQKNPLTLSLLALTMAVAAPGCILSVNDDGQDQSPAATGTAGTGSPTATTTAGSSNPGTTGQNSSTDGTGTKPSPEEIVKGACTNTLGIEMPENCASLSFQRPVEGMSNFRQFTAPLYSEALPNNRIYRSDALHKLSAQGQKTLQNLGIRTIVDLRSSEEIAEDPDLPVPGAQAWVNFPIGHDPDALEEIGVTKEDAAEIKRLFLAGEFAKIDAFLKEKNLDIEKLRIDRYKEFAFNFNASLAGTLRVLTDPNAFPVLFHCQGGKDRTGYVAAVMQRIAGWDQRDIERDYISTNFFTYDEILPMYQSGVMSLRPAFGAHLSQLRGALAAVDAKYPVFSDYLKLELGLTQTEIDTIRKNLTGK